MPKSIDYSESNRTFGLRTMLYAGAKDALWWAATTYVVAALGALANLLYYLSIFLNRRRDD